MTYTNLLVKEVVSQAKDGRQLLSGAFQLPIGVCGLLCSSNNWHTHHIINNQ
jgi:hypothetical protein